MYELHKKKLSNIRLSFFSLFHSKLIFFYCKLDISDEAIAAENLFSFYENLQRKLGISIKFFSYYY